MLRNPLLIDKMLIGTQASSPTPHVGTTRQDDKTNSWTALGGSFAAGPGKLINDIDPYKYLWSKEPYPNQVIEDGWLGILQTRQSTCTSTGFPKKQNLRIMPLGASITYGVGSTTGNGYRQRLLDILKLGGNKVDYVGELKSGTMADPDNEGFKGKLIDEVAKLSRAKIESSKPNIVLLHVGTNDMVQSIDLNTAPQRLGAFVDEILKASPRAVVIVSELIVSRNADVMKRIKAFNPRAMAEMKKRRQAGKHVLTVAPHVQTSQMSDDFHPNNAGYNVMAESWAKALEESQKVGLIKNPA